MTDVRRVPSAEFRVIYGRLEEPVDVTVLGRVIGTWTPVGSAPRSVHPEPEAVLTSGHGSPASTGMGGQSEAPSHGGAVPSASRSGASRRGPATAPARRSIQQTLDRAAKEGRSS